MMDIWRRTMFLGLAVAVLLTACTQERETKAIAGAALFLPSNVDSVKLIRASEVSTYVGDSLFEYINGGAELYHTYGFVEVATAYYRLDGREITLDVYRFADSPGAYGLYSMLRPDGVETLPIGAEGFSSGGTLDFVKGSFLVRFTSLEGVGGAADKMLPIAKLIEERLPGDEAKPAAFALLPKPGRLPATEKLYAGSFLGQQSLTDVYSCGYQHGGDTLTLFLTEDISGEKLLLWLQSTQASAAIPDILSFAAGHAIAIEDRYHGNIVAGQAAGKLVGAVGFDDRSIEFVADWANSLE